MSFITFVFQFIFYTFFSAACTGPLFLLHFTYMSSLQLLLLCLVTSSRLYSLLFFFNSSSSFLVLHPFSCPLSTLLSAPLSHSYPPFWNFLPTLVSTCISVFCSYFFSITLLLFCSAFFSSYIISHTFGILS